MQGIENVSSSLELYVEGARAWFSHDNFGWIGGSLIRKDVSDHGAGDSAVKLSFLLDNGHEVIFESSRAHLQEGKKTLPFLHNPAVLEGVDDLTLLSYLHEPAVLHTIKYRYAQEVIYTYSGIVLIAMNPFKTLPIYSPEVMRQYAGKKREEVEPHLFAVAEEAYRNMRSFKKNQSIIVSGESGAGKTQSAKYVMRYFATVDELLKSGSAAKKDMTEVEEAVLSTNPIMEAFGNAKTTRNDNSSRFGKYIEIQFSPERQGVVSIVGARIRTFLLERSRLISQANTERNYHIFYQLCAACPAAERKELGLGQWDTWEFLKNGRQGTIAGVDDAKDFAITQKALSTIGIQVGTQWNVFKVLAALLHLGNIKVESTSDGEGAQISEDDPNLDFACRLLAIDKKEFVKWLTKKQLKTRFESIMTNMTSEQAKSSLDSVAKFIFSALFDWIVTTINANLSVQNEADSSNFIGVLDIYGFEHFQTNSFEQFCINYANEKLQQEFNQHVFKLEQEEYVREEIEWSFIDFADNKECIAMIESKLGILSLLDEESRMTAGTDESFTLKLYKQFENEKVFEKSRFGQDGFTIRHYATDVTYSSVGFLSKNKDSVNDDQLQVFHGTSNSLFKEMLPPLEAQAKPKTLGALFKASLIQLMETIHATQVHYVRCIKPNSAKVAFEFEPLMVLQQLRACGVLETIRISCAGYPSRWTYSEFCERYYLLAPSAHWKKPQKDLVKVVIESNSRAMDKVQFGKTKVFMRAGMLAYLEKLRMDRLCFAATTIQRCIRGRLARLYVKMYVKSIVRVQACVRGTLARIAYKRLLEAERLRKEQELRESAAVQLQSYFRSWIAQAKLRNLKEQRRLKEIEMSLAAKASQVKETPLGDDMRSTAPKDALSGSVEFDMNAGRSSTLAVQPFPTDARGILNLEKELEQAKRELKACQHENRSLKDKLKELKQANDNLNAQLLSAKSQVKPADSRRHSLQENAAVGHSSLTSRRRSEAVSSTVASPESDGNAERLGLSSAVGRALLSKTPLTPEMAAMVDREMILLSERDWEEELVESIIIKLRIPLPSNLVVLQRKDIFYPAHLIGMCVEKLTQYDMTLRAVTLSARVCDAIQQLTSRFEDDYMSAFWLSNCAQYICVLQRIRDATAGVGSPGPGTTGNGALHETGKVVNRLQDDAEKLLLSLHYGWMQALKRRVGNMIIPAIIENQSLPGYVCRQTGGIWNRLRSATAPVPYNIDQLLNFLTKLTKSMSCYYMETTISKQILIEIFHTVGVQSFNHLLMRRNFCTWKRGVQIQYNLTRLEEWCQSHGIPDATIHLQQLMQAAKLLTLNKTKSEDINTIFDVCFLLNTPQIKKLFSLYTLDEYEAPLAPDVLQALNNRPVIGDENDPLLLDSDDSNIQFRLPAPQPVTCIHRFMPNWSVAPHLKLVSDLS